MAGSQTLTTEIAAECGNRFAQSFASANLGGGHVDSVARKRAGYGTDEGISRHRVSDERSRADRRCWK